jgi:hypothetical protein
VRAVEERVRLVTEWDGMKAERDRHAAELRAVRGAPGERPRTGADLRTWREDRGFTQKEAAAHLGVGHATIKRAEVVADAAPLGSVLRRALERDAKATR